MSDIYTASDGSRWDIERFPVQGWGATKEDSDGEINRYGHTREAAIEKVELYVAAHLPVTLGDAIARTVEQAARERMEGR